MCGACGERLRPKKTSRPRCGAWILLSVMVLLLPSSDEFGVLGVVDGVGRAEELSGDQVEVDEHLDGVLHVADDVGADLARVADVLADDEAAVHLDLRDAVAGLAVGEDLPLDLLEDGDHGAVAGRQDDGYRDEGGEHRQCRYVGEELHAPDGSYPLTLALIPPPPPEYPANLWSKGFGGTCRRLASLPCQQHDPVSR